MTSLAYEHLSNDPTINCLLMKHTLPIIESDDTPIFESLIKAIVSQQLSTKAAATIYGRFINLFENQNVRLDYLITLDHDTLRSVGLSNQKAVYAKNVAKYFLSDQNKNIHWQGLSDEEITTRLCSIKGVGIWTVQMILIFNLCREDVLPLGDLIVKRGLMNVLDIKIGDKNGDLKIIKKSIKWSPYRSYVSRLMWADKDEVIKF